MVRLEHRSDVGQGVVVVTLDRPERRNAVDLPTLTSLLQVQERAADARVVVVTGAPPAFSAGADLTGVGEDEFAGALRQVLDGFATMRAVVIAAVDGPALGAGAQLVAFADLRVATPASVIGVPAAKLGLVVEQDTVARLAREFGWATARAMLVGAETFSGARLHDLGAVHRLGGLDEALGWAADLARLAPLTIAGHKVALEAVARGDLDAADAADARAAAWRSNDAAEGRQAFIEKRPPKFTGA